MKKLTKKQNMIVAGGSEGNKEQPTSEKVKDVANDGLEGIGNTMEKLSEKIHRKVDRHYDK
jgi:hypothetical protein